MESHLKFLHWSNNPDCTAQVSKYFDGYHSVQMMTRGTVQLEYDEEIYNLGSTTFWFHYPGPHIRLAVAGGKSWHHRHIAFRGNPCERWLADGLLAQPPLSCPWDRRREFLERFDKILLWVEQGRLASEAKARAALELLLWELWEIRREPVEHQSILSVVTDTVTARKFQTGGYERIASELGISLSTLRRRVMDATGMSLHRFTRSLRVREARRLLRQTDRSLTQIAEDLGFADEYYFNREFTVLAGLPPGAYRRSLL